jgi:hypothetical protein
MKQFFSSPSYIRCVLKDKAPAISLRLRTMRGQFGGLIVEKRTNLRLMQRKPRAKERSQHVR